MSVASPRLVYPMTQLSAWHRLQSELGQKNRQHQYVAVQEPQKPEMGLTRQNSPARSTPVVVSKLGQKEFQQLSVAAQPRQGKLEVEKAHEGSPAGRQTLVRA